MLNKLISAVLNIRLSISRQLSGLSQRFEKSGRLLAITFLVGLLATGMTGIGQGSDQPSARYLVLISIDGLNPQWYQNTKWPMPFLQQKAREGAYARRVRPVFPAQTRPGHTTLITGWLPAKHGVYNNSASYRLDEGSSIFHAVSSEGGKTAAVGWVGSNHAPTDHIVLGVDATDFSDMSNLRQGKGLERSAGYSKEKGHSGKYERYITGTVRDARLASMGIAFIEQYQPKFLALRFNETDATQHRYGREHAAVSGIVASTDLALSEIEAAVERAGIKDQTVFMVTGDHGMDSIHTVLRPNIWLEKSGLGAEDEVYFEVHGGAAFLHGADEGQTKKIVDWLDNLPDSLRSKFTLFSRERLDELGSDPRVTLALNAMQGYKFDGAWEGPVQYQRNEREQVGNHAAMPSSEAPNNYTGFVVWGAGIESDRVLDEIGVEDIAPTAAELIGVTLGERDGRSLVPILRKNK